MGKFLHLLQERIKHWIKPATSVLIIGILTDLAGNHTDLVVEIALLRLAKQLGLSIYLESDLQERKLSHGDLEDFFRAVEATWRNPAFTHTGGESSIVAQLRGSAIVEHLLIQHPN